MYGDNPFVRVPADYPDDRFYDLVHWKAGRRTPTDRSGVRWKPMSAQAGGERCTAAIQAMKIWPALAYGGTIAAALPLLRRIQPDRATSATLAYAWSPLVLLETLQNGHNDVVAALPTLLAVVAGQAGRWRIAFPLLAVGFLVKPLAVVLGPVLLVAAWRAGGPARRDAAIGIALAAVGVLVAYAPFLNGLATFQGLERSDLFSASPAELLMLGLSGAGFPLDQAMVASRAVTLGAFAALTVVILVGVWRGSLSVTVASAALLLSYLLVGAQWFNPWYLLWLLPVALMSPETRLWRVAVLFSLLAPLTYLLQYDARLVVPLVFLPTAGLALLWWVVPAMQGSSAPAAPAAVPSPHGIGCG